MKPLSFRRRAELFSQLAKLEAAGIPFDNAMQSIRLPSPDGLRLDAMRSRLKSNRDLAFAGQQSGVFTSLESKLIRAALNAGSPAPTYERFAERYTQRAMQVASMRAKLAYPAFLFSASLVLTPLPSLVGGEISFFGYLWRILRPLLLLCAGAWLIRWWLQSAPNAGDASRISRVPFYGPIYRKSQFRDFFESLALLLEAGVPMLDALPMAVDTVEDGPIRRELSGLRAAIEKGASLHEALRGVGPLEGSRVIDFVETGETAGKLPEMLRRYVAVETADINGFYAQLATWAPKIVYGVVVLFVAYNLLMGAGVMPRTIE
jgi:general secretion pathway protein F